MVVMHIRRIIVFTVFGITGFFLGIALMHLFVSVMDMNATIAYIVQTIITVSINYVMNWRFTWGDRRAFFWYNAYRFGLSRITMIGLSTVLFAILVNYLGLNYQLVNIGLTLTSTTVTYVISHKWLFATTTPTN